MNTSDYYFCTSGKHRLPRPRPGLLIRFGVAPGLAGLPPLIQKGAAGKACEDNNWKLAVKLLELMPKRGLSPAASVWRKVLSTCCKNEKSRKATAILLDWVSWSVGMPTSPVAPLSVCSRMYSPLFVFRSLWRRRGKPKSLQYPYSTRWCTLGRYVVKRSSLLKSSTLCATLLRWRGT